MAGLLDSKKRIFDTLTTSEGRRQMARGKMRIRFATFTDQDAFYEYDAISGSTDASERPHLEAFSRPQDQITFEADDVGNLIQSPGGNFSMKSGHILVPSGSGYLNFPPIAERKALSQGALSASFDAFQQLYAISTVEPLLDSNEFNLSRELINFDITDSLLSDRQGITVTSLENVESLFQDRRLSHSPNFKYLPPVNAPTINNPKGSPLGDYPRLDQGDILTLGELMNDLEGTQKTVVNFSETSTESNLFGQIFDVRDNRVIKLDVIDFGDFVNNNGDNQHIFFIGRIFQDARGSDTFINIFTVIFS